MKTFILALFGLLTLVNAAPQQRPFYGINGTFHYKRPKRHENTKDKREANPEAWDLQEEDVYGEPRRVHAKYDYERRDKREVLRHPDLTMDVPDYFDNGHGYGAAPAPTKHENTKDKREANPEAWDLNEEELYGEPGRAHAKHENTKDKREAIPDGPQAGAYPELTDAVIGAKETLGASVSVDEGFEILKKEIVERYGVREKREEHRTLDPIAAADNLDYDMNLDELAKPYRYV